METDDTHLSNEEHDKDSTVADLQDENSALTQASDSEDVIGKKDVDDLSDLFEEAPTSGASDSLDTNTDTDDVDVDSERDSQRVQTHDLPSEEKQEKSNQEVPPSTPNTPISDLPIEIALEVGTHLIALNDLLELKEGATLELGDTLSDEVRLLVDGHCIGRAEIVTIGDKTGIRILDLVKPLKS